MTAPHLTETERAVLQTFKERLQRRYGERLVELRLFGSRARRDHRDTSDADVAVVLRGGTEPWSRLVWDMADDTFDVLIDHGIDIQPLPLDQTALDHPETHDNPELIRTILREGLRL